MALKNTYSKLPVARYIEDAQTALVKAGASGVSFGYDEGRIIALTFMLKIGSQEISFRLPVSWRKFQNVLRKERNVRSADDDYSYRVAWACTKDWIEAQMAFVESENVTVPQVFLPYAVVKGGETLFEKVAINPDFLLGQGVIRFLKMEKLIVDVILAMNGIVVVPLVLSNL